MLITQVQPYSTKDFSDISLNSCPSSSGPSNRSPDSSLIRSLVRLLFKQAYLTHPAADQRLDRSWWDRVESGIAGYFQNNGGYLEQSLRLAHHLSWATWTGYYSIQFNRTLDRSETFTKLPLMSRADLFPEGYANSQINSVDQELIERRINREFTALQQAFTLALTQVRSGQIGINQVKFFRSNDQGSLDQPDELSEDLYSQSYRKIVLREHLTGTLFDLTRSTYSQPVQRQLIFGSNGHGQTELYSLDMHELLRAVHQGQINSRTHLPIDPISVNLIQTNYRLELNLMYFHSC